MEYILFQPIWFPQLKSKVKVVHLYLWSSSYDQVSPVCCNFCFPSWNLFIFGSCLIIILLHPAHDAPTPCPTPKGQVHLYPKFPPVCCNFCFSSWNIFIFGSCLLTIILPHPRLILMSRLFPYMTHYPISNETSLYLAASGGIRVPIGWRHTMAVMLPKIWSRAILDFIGIEGHYLFRGIANGWVKHEWYGK